jgi:putative nucleotidyltransferase with HDIG domain
MTPAQVAQVDAALAAALPAGSLYAVGGRVRDEIRTLLDGQPRPFKDLDYVVAGLTLEDLIARLGATGTAELVGASFAVVKWHRDGLSADVALPRRERSTGLGHRDFVVEAAGPEVSLEDDLARRDFRMNMIARALPSGRLVDPYGGERDIRAGRIDLLRERAFEEDPLRMLRAAQFAARFGYTLSPLTERALKASAGLVATVSPERVRDELSKLLIEAPRPSRGFDILLESGVLAAVLPELAEGVGVEQNDRHRFDVYRHTMAVLDAVPAGDLDLRLAALLHDVAKPRTKSGPHFYGHETLGAEMAGAILERLRFSGETIATVTALVRHHLYLADPAMKPAALRRFIRRVGPERLERLFALRRADVAGSGLAPRSDDDERFSSRVWSALAEHPPLHVRDLQVGGADAIAALVAAGVLPAGSRGGPAVGRLLDDVLEAVLDQPDLDRSAQLKLLAKRAPLFHGERSSRKADQR